MSRLLLTCLLYFVVLMGYAQVREVKSRAEDYKNDRNTDSDYSYSGSENTGGSFLATLFGDLIVGSIYHGFNTAQFYQLNNAPDEDWRISAEFRLYGGANTRTNNYFNTQVIRGNWGLFSTEVRRMNVNDVSGGFTTIDWQILQLNLINRENVRWVLGGGFSHEVAVNQAHFEYTTALYVLVSDAFMPFVTYRKSADGYPREEFTANFEFRPFRSRREEFSFSAGYLYQRLYGVEWDFHFPNIGISFYLK